MIFLLCKTYRKFNYEFCNNENIASFFSPGQSHSSVERAGLLGGIKLRPIKADKNNQMRGEALEEAIKEDIAAGYIPFYVRKTHKINQNLT